MKNNWYAVIGGILFVGLLAMLSSRGESLNDSTNTDQTNALSPAPTSATLGTSPTTSMTQYTSAPELALEEGKNYSAKVTTNKGSFTINLFESKTPVTVNNFVFLAKEKFYDSVPFHRVIQGFMVQTGDPTGTGAGGPGYRFNDEDFEGEYTRGTVAMANAGPNTNGSQFFIMHEDYALPPNYVIFGEVTEGMEVVDAIATSPVEPSERGELSVPTVELFIESVEIVME